MSETYTTDRKCDICGVEATFKDGEEPKGWEPLGFNYNNHYFPDIDICPGCVKKMLGNKAMGRVSDIIMKAIESVQS